MQDFQAFGHETWNPFEWFGYDHPLLYINIPTVTNTAVVLVCITLLLLVCRYFLSKPDSLGCFMITAAVRTFMNLTIQTLGSYMYNHFAFVFSIFLFILSCNWISIIPWTEEPTMDLNTTVAVALIAFLYKELFTIKTHGMRGYIKEFFEPFFVMFPLNIIGHFSKIISLSFRLYGNIFGGAIIVKLYNVALSESIITQVLGLGTGMNFVVLGFFTIFEGFIQAFVFAMLSLTYLSIAIAAEETPEVAT